MASLTGPTTRRGLLATAGAGLLALVIPGGDATGQDRTAHLAPAAAEITASVRCPRDMMVRFEAPHYIAYLEVSQDRTPASTHPLLAGTPRTEIASVGIRRKTPGQMVSQGTDAEFRLPIQVSFGQHFADSRISMDLPHKRELPVAQVAEIQALGNTIIQQIRALAPQVCGTDATDRTIPVAANDPRLQPIMANVERLYLRSRPPVRISLQ